MPRLALVTGATSGLGKALCLKLSAEGFTIIASGRNEERLKELATLLPPSTQTICVNLESEEERKKLLAQIEKLSIDLVINNAGFGLYGPILDHPLSCFQKMMQVNGQAVMEISIAAARAMQKEKKQGVILNIASAAAFVTYPTFCVYSATKEFVRHFSCSFDEEMKPYGIRILTSCPGQIDTPFRDKAASYLPQKKNHWMIISQDKAACLIIKQIQTKKQMEIIDWRYKWLVQIHRLIPKKVSLRVLINNLKDRYHLTSTDKTNRF